LTEQRMKIIRRKIITKFREMQRENVVRGFCAQHAQNLYKGKEEFINRIAGECVKNYATVEEKELAFNYALILFEAFVNELFMSKIDNEQLSLI